MEDKLTFHGAFQFVGPEKVPADGVIHAKLTVLNDRYGLDRERAWTDAVCLFIDRYGVRPANDNTLSMCLQAPAGTKVEGKCFQFVHPWGADMGELHDKGK